MPMDWSDNEDRHMESWRGESIYDPIPDDFEAEALEEEVGEFTEWLTWVQTTMAALELEAKALLAEPLTAPQRARIVRVLDEAAAALRHEAQKLSGRGVVGIL